MSAKLKGCPKCGGKMIRMALIDSSDRIYLKWDKCEFCGYDSRKPKEAPHV